MKRGDLREGDEAVFIENLQGRMDQVCPTSQIRSSNSALPSIISGCHLMMPDVPCVRVVGGTLPSLCGYNLLKLPNQTRTPKSVP